MTGLALALLVLVISAHFLYDLIKEFDSPQLTVPLRIIMIIGSGIVIITVLWGIYTFWPLLKR